MKFKNIKPYYRQSLPHFQPIGAIFFVTFRLKDSIPKAKLIQLKQDFDKRILTLKTQPGEYQKELIREERNQFFLKYDKLLDNITSGPHYLKHPEIAKIVEAELHKFDCATYDLIAYCIMSNHVHILIDTHIQLPEKFDIDTYNETHFEPLQNIMKRIKGPTAVYANRSLKRNGKFWQRESFDRVVRNEKEFQKTITYILENPVEAGIVEQWDDYPYSYYKYM